MFQLPSSFSEVNLLLVSIGALVIAAVAMWGSVKNNEYGKGLLEIEVSSLIAEVRLLLLKIHYVELSNKEPVLSHVNLILEDLNFMKGLIRKDFKLFWRLWREDYTCFAGVVSFRARIYNATRLLYDCPFKDKAFYEGLLRQRGSIEERLANNK